ncbi:MAG: hypothetical protein COB01_02585 [Lutibacter sp.]|nr:MAG: hypothetical protein COB01_02585 [Lutibacter sp.]
MKKPTFKIVFLATAVLVYACGNQSNETKKTPSTIETPKVEAVQSHKETGMDLSLDQGKFWKANKETTDGVQNMIELMKNFNEKEHIDSYEKLTERLKQEFTMIFEKCTMKGEAHNQLHNFLIPIKDLFGELSSKDLNKCKESFNKLNMHLAVYKGYFE